MLIIFISCKYPKNNIKKLYINISIIFILSDFIKSNNDKKVTTSGTDCLAYRRPWATPPTAISESTKLQIGGCT